MSMFMLCLLVMVVVAGCAPAGDGGPSTGGTGPDSPKYGGVLRASIGVDPYDWDPVYRGRSGSAKSYQFGHVSLLGFKTGPDVPFADLVLRPEVAQRWELSPDAKTFTFHLRKGIKFADRPPVNGREATAADVKFSYEYFGRIGEFRDKEPRQSDVAQYVQGLERVETPDTYTVVLSFKEPNVPFINYAAFEALVVLPRETYDREGNYQNTIIGAGPFILDTNATQKGTRWVWKKNAGYFETGRPYLDGLDILVLPDDTTANVAFQTKQLDYLNLEGAVGYRDAQQVMKANPDAVVGEYEPAFAFIMYYNVRVPPLDDVRVRRAVNLAINPDEFIRGLQGGRGQWMAPAIPLGFFSQEETKLMLKHDVDQAKRLLAEAGYNNAEIELTFPRESTGPDDLAMLELFQSQQNRAGIRVVLKALDKATESRDRQSGKFGINIGAAGSSGSIRLDPEAGISRFHRTSSQNYSGIDDPDLSRLIEAQRREGDTAKRRELIRQAGRMMADKAYSHGFYSRVEYSFWQPRVKNLYRNANAGRLEATDIWVDR